jgi:hypothetical protein
MSQLTIDEIRERKAELEKQFARLLAEFEEQSGITVTDVRYLDAGILTKNKPYIHIATETRL